MVPFEVERDLLLRLPLASGLVDPRLSLVFLPPFRDLLRVRCDRSELRDAEEEDRVRLRRLRP